MWILVVGGGVAIGRCMLGVFGVGELVCYFVLSVCVVVIL